MGDKTPPSHTSQLPAVPKAPAKIGRRLPGYYRPVGEKGSKMDKEKGKLSATPFEPKLEELFKGIFSWTDDDPDHEIKEAMDHMNVVKWAQFIRMRDEDIQALTKHSRGEQRVEIGLYSKYQLTVLRQMIRENIKAGVTGAREIETYNLDKFIEYEFKYSEEKRQQAPTVTTTVTTQGAKGNSNYRHSKSESEKKLEAWQRLKPDKNDFDILRNDGSYEEWKESFASVAEVQTLSRAIDPTFDPKKLTDTHDIELWNKQQAYMWTVLKRVFKNPLGITCYNDFKSTRDARSAYLAHEELQQESPARMFDTGTLITQLKSMHIHDRRGSRVQFISDWFSKMQEFNDITPKQSQLGYHVSRAVLLSALNTDNDMTNAFTDLRETGKEAVDIESMKRHLLTKAALFDGMDNTSNSTKGRSASSIAAMAHQLGIEDLDVIEFMVNKSRRAPDPAVKLPEPIYSTLDRQDRTQWHGFSDSAKRSIVAALPTAHDNNTRKAYEHSTSWNTNQSPTGVTFEIDTAPSTSSIRDLEDIVVKATTLLSAFKSDSSTAPSSISSQSPSKDSKATKSKDKALPLKSEVPPAHPSRIMANEKEPIVDANGNFSGFRKQYKHEILPTEACKTYSVSNRSVRNKSTHALVDRGANGIVAGADCTWIGGPVVERHVHITGMDNHQIRNIKVGTVGARVISNRGPVICIFNEVAYTGRNQTILSAIQMEHYKNKVDDRSIMSGGGQQITTADGYTFPLSIVNGLPYLQMKPYTHTEYINLPHVILSSEEEWDPRVFDNEIDPESSSFASANPPNLHLLPHDDYNAHGEYIGANVTEVGNPQDVSSQAPNIEFWIDDREYRKHETVARCMYDAQRGQPTDYDASLLQVHERNFVATGEPRTHIPTKMDYESLKPFFAWIPTHMIKKTFQNSTQYGYAPSSPDGNLFKRWHSPNPALNVFRLQDDLLTDKVYSNTPAIEGGFTEAQIFIGRKSHIIHPESISKTKPFLKCLQNFVRKWGAPIRLLADHIKYHASFRVLDYLRILWIGLWFSEAYYQHQNPFERRYQTFKRITNRTMDRTNTPPELWFLCMCYVAYVMNRVSDPTLHDRQPIFAATGHVGDISALTTFQWLEPVYYKQDTKQFSFPDTGETFGYFVGIAEHVGHAMTYRIWNKETGHVVERSAVRSAHTEDHVNKRAHPSPTPYDLDPPIPAADGEQQHTGRPPGVDPRPNDFIYSTQDTSAPAHITTPDDPTYGEQSYLREHGDDEILENEHDYNHTIAEDGTPMVVLLGDDMKPKLDSEGNAIMIPGQPHDEVQGKTFKKEFDDGTIRRARIVGPVQTDRHTNKKGRQLIHDFRIKYDSNQVEEVMTYSDVMNHLHQEANEGEDKVWSFRRILAHQGPLSRNDPNYKNSKYNVRVEWETGEITDEPLNVMITDAPIPLAQYALKNKLLEREGWRSLKRIARREKKLKRMANQARLRSFRTEPKYMYGFQVPRDYKEALELDKRNGNTKWEDSTKLEMEQLFDYNTFRDIGLYSETKIPTGFKRIRVHLVFAVKHDGRHKSRLVADGHLTDVPLDSVYAGVVSIRGLRTVLFLAELNGLEAYATDIGNAYLEAMTQEKVCIKAGPEFGPEHDGHLLIIHKALYGLRSSGKQFGDLLASCLKELGFFQSLAEPQIFMRESDGIYEYVATYVDDLCFVMRNPEAFLVQLQSEPYNFKLKGSGPMSFHLGCGFERDQHGTLCMNPRTFIDKMLQAYEQMFGASPGTKPMSPLTEGDHPELDISDFLSDDDTQKYQSLIGSLQWLITLGRWDIQTAVMTMSSFRSKPREGHMLRVKRIYAYINRFKHFMIRFRTQEPDLSNLDRATHGEWDKSVYEEFHEELPTDAPEPLGKRVTLIHWFDANLMHDVLSGKSVTGCIHYFNKTPMMWYSKKQATSETATYGAEFVAGRTCIEQIVDLRQSLRYLGVPVHDISYVFGDNESMINSSTYTYSRLHKRHNILSYHYVRSMIARGFIALTHTSSESNLADVVTKHWSHRSVYDLLRPVFHHVGDTATLYIDDDPDP